VSTVISRVVVHCAVRNSVTLASLITTPSPPHTYSATHHYLTTPQHITDQHYHDLAYLPSDFEGSRSLSFTILTFSLPIFDIYSRRCLLLRARPGLRRTFPKALLFPFIPSRATHHFS
jgi:hypothetical protein